jgi:hypothetical protein
MLKTRRTAVLVAAAVLASLTPAQAQQQPSTKPSAAIDELLWWLPLDTETVEARQTPARPRGTPIEKLLAEVDFDDDDLAHNEILARNLADIRVKASLAAARRFRAPSGLGGALFEGATLYLLERPLPSAGAALMAELAKQALNMSRVGQIDVVEFQDKLELDIWTSYISVPRPDVLVVATNLEYLREVLKRTTTRAGARAFPIDLPEWQWIDARSPYWALRHYRREHSREDPSSPFKPEAPPGRFDKGAVGLVAHAEDDGRTMVVHYLSRGGEPLAVMRHFWLDNGERLSPTIQSVASDVVEVRFTTGNNKQLGMFLFHLFAALGHVIYL